MKYKPFKNSDLEVEQPVIGLKHFRDDGSLAQQVKSDDE